jgi:hypothetical protein
MHTVIFDTVTISLVATVLGAMAVSLVFFSWNYISRHTIVQQRKSMFQAEADRMAQAIALEIRKSPEVFSWKDNSTTFLSSTGSDTITYGISNGAFLKNEVPVSVVASGAFVSQFSIERENPSDALDASKTIMLSITLVMQDQFGNASTIPIKIRANAPHFEPLDDFSRGLR